MLGLVLVQTCEMTQQPRARGHARKILTNGDRAQAQQTSECTVKRIANHSELHASHIGATESRNRIEVYIVARRSGMLTTCRVSHRTHRCHPDAMHTVRVRSIEMPLAPGQGTDPMNQDHGNRRQFFHTCCDGENRTRQPSYRYVFH